jgi:hypothetical protein
MLNQVQHDGRLVFLSWSAEFDAGDEAGVCVGTNEAFDVVFAGCCYVEHAGFFFIQKVVAGNAGAEDWVL